MTGKNRIADLRAMLGAVVLVTLAGCASGEVPAASSDAAASASPTPRSPIATVPASPAPAPTPRASRSATQRSPTPEPTAPPVPGKPTGIGLDEDIEELCDDEDPAALCGVGDSTFTLSWNRPRAKGIEIRAYGVTVCLETDPEGQVIDGWCLRKDTELATSQLVLLGRAPARDGHLEFTLAQDEHFYATLRGKQVYAFVLGAYNADGAHADLAIAARAEACVLADDGCTGENGPAAFEPGSWMASSVNDLRVRSRPRIAKDSIKYTPVLRSGTEFGIVRGPVEANGYRWYLVQLTPGTLDGGSTRGWVAEGSRYGEPWIENIGIDEG